MKFFVINEKNALQIKINILEQFIKHNIKDYEFVEFDKSKLNSNIIDSFVENYHTSLILNFLSHFYIYKEIYTKYNEAIILEGDFILNEKFIEKLNNYYTKLPKDYDILFVGENNSLKTNSYIVSKKCANKLCIKIQNIANKIDHSFNYWLNDIIRQLALNVIYTNDQHMLTVKNVHFRKIFFPYYNYSLTPTFFYKPNQKFIKNKTKPNVAIVFFGLTRSIYETIDSMQNYIFKPIIDLDMEYDIFMHTYIINGEYSNNWSKEYVKEYDNEQYKLLNPKYFIADNQEEILSNIDLDMEYDIFMHTYIINGEYCNQWSNEYTTDYDNNQYKLLNPKYFITDNQEEILSNIDLEKYYTKLQSWTGYDIPSTKYLIRNMILALKSKKKIIELLEKHMDEYDYVIITRPDLKWITPIPWQEIIEKLTDTNIIIPSKDWWSGCNDKICICKPNVALYVGKSYDYLQQYSTYKSIVSEVFLKDMLDALDIEITTCEIDYETVRISSR